MHFCEMYLSFQIYGTADLWYTLFLYLHIGFLLGSLTDDWIKLFRRSEMVSFFIELHLLIAFSER